MNLIVIDFTISSEDEIKKICDKFNFDYKIISKDKKKFKLKKIFIDTVTKKLIAYTTKKDPLLVLYTDAIGDVFLNLPIFQLDEPKIESSLPIKLDVDSILEKIHKYGMNSLSKEERNFMDEESKK
jgi:hypothetical protein